MRAPAAVLLGLLLILVPSAPARADGPVESPQPAQPPPPPPPSGNEGPVQPVTTQERTVEERKSGFEGGARLGVAIPFGKLDGRDADNQKLNDFVSASIPIWLDAGYRFNGRWYVGAYGIIAPAITNGSNCPDCSAANYKIGVNGHVHILPEGAVDPYFGYGLGYEVVTVTVKNVALAAGGFGERSLSAKGFEFANVQFGLDIRVTDLVRIRPFVSLALDMTTSYSVTNGNISSSTTDVDTTVHEWLSFGVGGVFNP